MRSFRQTRRRASASPPVVLIVLVLLTALLLVRNLPERVAAGGKQSDQDTTWKSSIIGLP